MSRGTMAARVFEDSAGVSWEVFEVHRTTTASGGVSQGLEGGWLAFMSATGKRRLAPFPSEWESASVSELERLCGTARPATPTNYPKRGPRIVRTPAEPPPAVGDASVVHGAVRAFARDARARKLPAIEAMLKLRMLLNERFSGSDVPPEARAEIEDRKRIRQWFVDAFYFERPD